MQSCQLKWSVERRVGFLYRSALETVAQYLDSGFRLASWFAISIKLSFPIDLLTALPTN